MLNPLVFHHHREDAYWIQSQLEQVPEFAKDMVIERYQSHFNNTDIRQSEARRNANLSLIDAVETAQNVKPVGHRKTYLSDDALALKAERLSLLARRLVRGIEQDQAFEAAQALLRDQGLAINPAMNKAGLVARVQDEQFWRRKLVITQDREQEHFMIATGAVKRGLASYISQALFSRIRTRVQNAYKAMEHLEAVCEETGERLDMSVILKGSMANPAIRRAELMVRMRGFEDAAKRQGHIGAFYTLTCPSKYHKTTNQGGKAKPNPMYQGSTPRQAQAYLTKVWARIRARLKYYELPVYGFRIAEPHADGCPHWHMLLFMNKADMKQINQIMRTYALAEEGQEKGARIHRFKVVKIDAKKGSATGYIAKYVSKNIDGFGLDEDFESGTQANDSASRVRAWASLWGIRQFQQIGGAPVGVWRELRRIDSLQEDTPYTLQKAYQAADGGDWDRYLSAQGGVINPRKDQPLKLYTLEKYDKSTGEVHTNKYGERVAKVQGISLWATPVLKTRVHTWRIERKVQDMSTLMSTPQAITYKPDFDLMGQVLQTFAPTSDGSSLSSESALSAPWSTGNNCTFSDLEHESRYEAQQERAAILLYNLEYEEVERVKQRANSSKGGV